METIKYGLIGKQDIKRGRSTFETTLGDGRVVALDEVNLDSFDNLLSEEDTTSSGPTELLELRHTVTAASTPAAGIGTSLRFSAQSGDENPADVASLEATLHDVTAGSEDSTLWAWLRVAGAALARKFGFRTTGAGSVLFSASNSSDITLSLPTSTDTLVGKATTDTLTNKTLTDPSVNAGGGSETLIPAGLITYDSTEAGCSGSSETDLISYSLPASSLSSNGDAVRVRIAGTTAANSNTKTIRLYFGASVVISNDITTAPSNKAWDFEALIFRDSSSTQEFVATGRVGAVLQTTAMSSLSATMSGAITIKVTGQGAATNDITAKFLSVEFLNA